MLRHLLVGGLPGAAVNQIAYVLNEHPKVIVGFERYARIKTRVDSYHLHARRILDPLPQETGVRGTLLYTRLRERRSADDLAYVGDASAGYGTIVSELADRIPSARLVIVLGPPPRTGAERLERWRAAALSARAADQQPHRRRVLVVPWEGWLAQDEPWLETLMAFLELPMSPRLEAEHARIVAGVSRPRLGAELPDSEIEELEQWRQDRAEEGLEVLAGENGAAPMLLPPLDDAPLTDTEAAERDAERAQLEEEHTNEATEWPELGALRRRYRDDSAILWSRGVRLRERTLTAATTLPNREFGVTIVNPFDVKDAIARSMIDQLAGALAHLVHVRLIRQ